MADNRTATAERMESTASQELLERLRDLLEQGQVTEARSLTREAAAKYPDDVEIQRALRVLAPGEARLGGAPEPTGSDEIAWLKDPPPEARGKWVALIGSRLVGMSESFEELMAAVRALKLHQAPLVHHLDVMILSRTTHPPTRECPLR